MASNTYGAIKLSTAEDVGAVLKKKTGSADGYKPKEWADTINLLGLLPIRTASGTIAHFEDGADDVPMKSVVANIEPIQSGSGTPSPSNPRPISGTSVLNVEKRGKNLVESKLEHCGIGAVGVLVVSSSQPYDMQIAKVKSGATYTITTDENTLVGGFFTSYPVNGSTTYDGQRVVSSSKTFTAPIDGYFAFRTSFGYATAQLEVGSTATTYEPYTGSTHTINLGRTVYGGSADVVGGVGSKTHGFLTLNGSEDWVNVGGSYPQAFQLDTGITNAFQGLIAAQKANNISNLYPWSTNEVENYAIRWQVGYQNGRLFVYDNNYSSNLAGFKQHLSDNNLQIAYLLATPTPFTFTGQPINSYLGVNNVWADSGEVLDVEYRADMNLLIAELGG